MAEQKEKTKKEKAQKNEAKKEPQQQPARVHQNGVTRPASGTRTGMVWDICDRLSKKLGAPVARKDVMSETKNCGINPATAATQYALWRRFHGMVQEKAVLPTAAKANEESAAEPMTVEEAASEAASEAAPEVQESNDSHPTPESFSSVPESCVAAPVEAPAAAMCSSD